MNESTKPSPRKGIYLLPNLVTTAALFSGFFAILAAMNGQFEKACIAVFVAMILDGLDGRVARWTNTSSEFGEQYDSLSDLVSFGLAPALVIYQWSLIFMRDTSVSWGKLGWMAAFIYVACAALRLARFNSQIHEVDKRHFIGLPSPASAAIVVGMVWMLHDLEFEGKALQIPALLITIFAGLLMVSNVKYNSFKDFDLKSKVPHLAILVIILIFALVQVAPPIVLFFVFFIYALSGPFNWLQTRRKALKRLSETQNKKTGDDA
ncbi:CDP-diacylglycerol--serine O-phosphatidyltransferase [Cocleimonas flava]|uniref:CDP-diacylglycerol--serine O-phosphatidyltransferase n=1 Tax=Cocleimonas flava TaxID=634765 RepID=A0A4R1EY45_9GAMM|nr:CDP-diacylglycerol--serine O-phosphatidyltransferase [Cocleimonas flava]TCJ84934.1 CDP-diacylglycerol--serine O-phosphatidyltransferase [Cocleimonas flava]